MRNILSVQQYALFFHNDPNRQIKMQKISMANIHLVVSDPCIRNINSMNFF